MNRILFSTFLFVFGSFGLHAVPAVLNYAGQVAVNGQPFDGQGLFKFALVNTDGNATYWSNDGSSANGSEPAVHVGIPVNGGLYSLLLGNTAMAGMGAIDPQVFTQHGDAKLRVWFSDGVNGFQQLSPDRPFASVPYAFSAGTATIASGSINKSMLGSDVIADLNKTVTITRDMLPQDVREDLNKTVTITRSMLPADVLADINRTISKSMLANDVLSDLNSTIGINRLSAEVTEKLDRNTTTTNYNSPSVGSLIAIPYGESAPAGYSLYQQGTPKELVWEEKAPVSVARYTYGGVEVLNGEIYFVGGKNVSAKKIAERYAPTTNTWETLASMSAARAGVATAVLNGKLYAIGGQDLISVEVYEPSTDTWSSVGSLPNANYGGSALAVAGKIFLFGSDSSPNQVLSFDPTTNHWLAKANMPTSRAAHKVVFFQNRIWAIGGSATNNVESYDLESDSWQTETSLSSPVIWGVAWVANGLLYTGGGHDNSQHQSSISYYDPKLEKWLDAGQFPEVKYAADAVVINDKVYVIAGHNGSSFSDKVFAADLNASVAGVYDLYRKDGNASAGTPLVQAEVADGSVTASKLVNNTITTSQLNEQILRYLKPEISQQPKTLSVVEDSNTSFSFSAEGKYLSYQWKKNGGILTGETNATLTITDANATQHDGNYSVVVTNEFGNVESNASEFFVIHPSSISQGLVGWWPLNGNTNDVTGNGNHGVVNGESHPNSRKLATGYYFNGVDNEINLGNSSSLNPTQSITLSAWFKIFDGKVRYSPIIERYSPTDGQRSYFLSTNYEGSFNQICFYIGASYVKSPRDKIVSYNAYYHTVATYDSSSEACLFLDGQLCSLTKVTSPMDSSQADTTIGGVLNSGAQYFHGIIYDVRIYDRALSAAEVQALYNMGQ